MLVNAQRTIRRDDVSFLSHLILSNTLGILESTITTTPILLLLLFLFLPIPSYQYLQPIPLIQSQSDRQEGVATKAANADGPPVDQLDDLLHSSFKCVVLKPHSDDLILLSILCFVRTLLVVLKLE